MIRDCLSEKKSYIMKTLLPCCLVDEVRNNLLEKTYEWDLTPSQFLKLNQHTLRLWLFVYHKTLLQQHGFWVNISRREFDRSFNMRVYPRRLYYRWFIDLLLEIGWLEENPKFKPDEYTKSFRIPEDLDYTPTEVEMPSTFSPKEVYLRQYDRDTKLIENHYKSVIDLKDAKTHIKTYKDLGYKGRRVSQKMLFDWYKLIHDFNHNNLWFKKCDGGRFYSTFTNMPQFLRNLIRIDGEECGTLDLSCSLPLFIAHHLDDPHFLRLCREGKMYEYIGGLTGYSRNTTKMNMFKYLFYCDKIDETNWWVKRIDVLFPGLITKLIRFRQSHYQTWKWYNELEVKLFLETFRDSDYPYLTCHDSITAPKKIIPTLQAVLQKKITDMGYEGKIKYSEKILK